MKRMTSLLLAFCFLLTLCACGGSSVSSAASEADSDLSDDSSVSSEAANPQPVSYLLDDELLAEPTDEFRMLKIANKLSKVYGEDTFTAYIGTLETYGYGGIVGNVSYTNYLENEKMWNVFAEQVEWTAEAGKRFWIYDEEGYPSGAAGGLVLQNNPEYEAMGVARVQVKVKGGELAEITEIPRSHTALFAYAFPGTGDQDKDVSAAVDISASITATNGLLWTAPEGEWVAELYLQKPLYEETHASSNVFADQRYINIMDKDAVRSFIDVTYEQYYQYAGSYFGNTIEAFFTDEPSLMAFNTSDYEGTPVRDQPDDDFVRYPTAAWSRDFFEQFETRMGYDITPYITYLFGGNSLEAYQTRYDYWKVASALIEEAYFEQLGDWCDEHDVAFSGHVLSEENLSGHVMAEGNLMQNYKHQGVVGIDLLTSDPDSLFWHCVTVKTAASAGRLYNKNGLMSEDSCFSDSGLTLDKLRAGLAVQYAMGVTQVTSYYDYNEIAVEGSAQEDRDDTGDMVARMGYALSGGEHVADAALYYPIESAFAEYLPNTVDWGTGLSMQMQSVSDGFSSNLRILLGNQIDTDILNEEAILGSTVEDGMLVSPGGEKFRVLVMPYVTMLSEQVVQKIAEIAAAGVPVVQLSRSDELMTQKGDDLDRVRALWEQIAETDGCARIASDASLAGTIKEMIATRDVVLSKSAPILYNHTAHENGDVYLLALYNEEDYHGDVTFRATGAVRLIDPLTGEISVPETTDNGDGTTTVSLSLEVYGNVIVEFSRL